MHSPNGCPSRSCFRLLIHCCCLDASWVLGASRQRCPTTVSEFGTLSPFEDRPRPASGYSVTFPVAHPLQRRGKLTHTRRVDIQVGLLSGAPKLATTIIASTS